MKLSKGQSQPEIVAAAFLILEAWFWGSTIAMPGFDSDSAWEQAELPTRHRQMMPRKPTA